MRALSKGQARRLKVVTLARTDLHDDFSGTLCSVIKAAQFSTLCCTEGRSLLHVAAAVGATDCLKYLVELPGVDLTARDSENGWTPLHRAMYHGQVSRCPHLLVPAPVISLHTYPPFSQLHAAVVLLEHRAPFYDVVDNDGNTPVDIATIDAGMPCKVARLTPSRKMVLSPLQRTPTQHVFLLLSQTSLVA